MITEHIEDKKVADAPSVTFEAAKALGEEYGTLMASETLSDEEEARIDHIEKFGALQHRSATDWLVIRIS